MITAEEYRALREVVAPFDPREAKDGDPTRMFRLGVWSAFQDITHCPGRALSQWQRHEVWAHSPEFAEGYDGGMSMLRSFLNQMRQIKSVHPPKGKVNSYGALPINRHK